jgi:hypothetical protein
MALPGVFRAPQRRAADFPGAAREGFSFFPSETD